jgi:hypothetical protein
VFVNHLHRNVAAIPTSFSLRAALEIDDSFRLPVEATQQQTMRMVQSEKLIAHIFILPLWQEGFSHPKRLNS